MNNPVDVGQGLWRFHTAVGMLTKEELSQNPAQPSGTNTDVVLEFKPHPEDIKLPEGLALSGTWFQGLIHPEDEWDTEMSKGKIRVKVFAAVPEAGQANQVIQIYQTEYRWKSGDYTGDLTIYTGVLYQPTPPRGQRPPPPIFFGYGADNAGRRWLTFSLRPSQAAE